MMFLLLLAVRSYVVLYANSTRWTARGGDRGRGNDVSLGIHREYAASWIPIWIPPVLVILLLYRHTQVFVLNG